MGRGYWLPPRHEHLAACDGFYIDSNAVYANGIDEGWYRLLEVLCKKITYHENSFEKLCCWKTCDIGQNYFVLLRNRHVEIIAEDIDGFVAVYVLVPEESHTPGMAKRAFPRYLMLLKTCLVDMFPGQIYKRINSQKIKSVE